MYVHASTGHTQGMPNRVSSGDVQHEQSSELSTLKHKGQADCAVALAVAVGFPSVTAKGADMTRSADAEIDCDGNFCRTTVIYFAEKEQRA